MGPERTRLSTRAWLKGAVSDPNCPPQSFSLRALGYGVSQTHSQLFPVEKRC